MSKYFNHEEKEKLRLSEYLTKEVKWLGKSERQVPLTKYIMDALGDVELEEEIYILFLNSFQSTGGRYDVRTKPETFKGLYEYIKTYPELSKRAIDELRFIYIKDLFEEYSLMPMLGQYIEKYGQTDDMFDLYIKSIEKLADKHQEKYDLDSLKTDELKEEYSESFISHIKSLIKREHYLYDDIKKYIPSAELISKDEQHLTSISKRTRIYFGCGLPVSYVMFDQLIENKTLEDYTQTPTYYISNGTQEQATFTKQEFLDSTKIKEIQK